MPFEVVTGPAEDVLTLAEAKAHLVVQHTEDDTLITRLISVATKECQNRLNRALITQTLRLWLDSFPWGYQYVPPHSWLDQSGHHSDQLGANIVELRRPPVQSVTEIKYVDPDGNLQTWDPANYVVDLITEPARIMPVYGTFWPITRRQINAVQIKFVAGYGLHASVPETIRQAALLMIGHWYLNKEAVVTGSISTEIQMTVDALLSGESWGGYVSP